MATIQARVGVGGRRDHALLLSDRTNRNRRIGTAPRPALCCASSFGGTPRPPIPSLPCYGRPNQKTRISCCVKVWHLARCDGVPGRRERECPGCWSAGPVGKGSDTLLRESYASCESSSHRDTSHRCIEVEGMLTSLLHVAKDVTKQ